MNDALRRLHRLVTTMHGQRALVVWRVIAGCTILSQYLSALPRRHFLLGQGGVFPAELAADTGMFGLYSLVQSDLGFELLYFGSIAVTLAWTLGVLAPLSTVAVLVLWRSTFDRLPGLGDGGDNLTHLLLTYALLTNVRGPGAQRWLDRLPTWARELRAMIHNTGLVAMWIQVCIVYFIAGAAKLHGEAWRNGTALYYALGTEQYSTPGLVEPLLDAPVLLTLLAYTTVVFQVGFPFLVSLNRHARRFALFVALTFHVGIATVMGLATFAVFMIAADLTFLTDAEVLSMRRRLERLWAKTRTASLSKLENNNHNNNESKT
ncbi:MAG: HTTM domain-containing protein [Nannocystaceae bacterium]|nr:HTTM domain-containing protein [bacterium]